MRVGPNAEIPQSKIDRERRGSDEKPLARWRFGLAQGSDDGIQQGRNREPGVNAGTPTTDGEGVTRDKERPFRNLMTDETERLNNGESPKWVSAREQERRADD